jgi:hypothetical protein
MYLTIFESEETGAGDGLTIDPASLYCAFEQVTDGRKKKGKRYPLPLLLTLLMLGSSMSVPDTEADENVVFTGEMPSNNSKVARYSFTGEDDIGKAKRSAGTRNRKRSVCPGSH